jgi:hypothetical protein
VGKTKRGKGTKWMVVVDGQGMPLGNLLESASPAEVTLLEPTLDTIAVPRSGPGRPRKNPERVIYDKACDSDPLRKRLARRGIELICPHRRTRSNLRCKMGGNCGATDAAGMSNAPAPGWGISAAWLCAGSAMS